MLRIVRLTKKTAPFTFAAEDVFSKEEVIIKLSARFRIHYTKEVLVEGDECVAQFSSPQPGIGRVVTPSGFKMDLSNDRWIEQGALKTRYEAEIGPYTKDYNWFHRPVK